MRLIAQFSSEQDVLRFSNFLFSHKIPHQYERSGGEESSLFDLWIHREDDLTRAFDFYQQFVLHPQDPRFALPEPKAQDHLSWKSFPLACALVAICCALFIWNSVQEIRLPNSSLRVTPLEQVLFFDDPEMTRELRKVIETHSLSNLHDIHQEALPARKAFQKATDIPLWGGLFPLAIEKIQKGAYAHGNKAPLFERIREGQVWRIITPAFMHQDLLHIAFNMAWLLILLRPIEMRLTRSKTLILVLLLAAFSNLCQYLMSGSYFLGFSGVIAGLAGFIWARQSVAPWEAYPINRMTLRFLFFMILILFFISVGCFILNVSGLTSFSSPIANTAHMSGGILGLVLGRRSFFARKAVS